MNDPIVVIGTGEMSGVFTRGFLKQGYPVFPVNRNTDMEKMAKALTAPALVLVAVGEADLHPVLEKIPAAWKDCLALLQNELLPRDWEAHDLQEPTVISVWFEKKKGQDFKVLVPSPTYGAGAPILEAAMESLGIPSWEVGSHAEIEVPVRLLAAQTHTRRVRSLSSSSSLPRSNSKVSVSNGSQRMFRPWSRASSTQGCTLAS